MNKNTAIKMTLRILLSLCALLLSANLLFSQYPEMREENGVFELYNGDKKISDQKYQAVTYKYGKLYGVKIDDKWGLISTDGEELIACKYDTLSFNSGDDVIVSQDGLVGVVSTSDSIIVDFIYEDVDYYSDDSPSLVKVSGRWGILEDGNIDYAEDRIVFKRPEIMPLYEYCDHNSMRENETIKSCSQRKMLEYVYGNIRYPKKARKNGNEGTVVISFVIDVNGQIADPEITRDIGGGCGEEAQRIIESMKRWQPGKQDGRNVKTRFNFPIKFRLR